MALKYFVWTFKTYKLGLKSAVVNSVAFYLPPAGKGGASNHIISWAIFQTRITLELDRMMSKGQLAIQM